MMPTSSKPIYSLSAALKRIMPAFLVLCLVAVLAILGGCVPRVDDEARVSSHEASDLSQDEPTHDNVDTDENSPQPALPSTAGALHVEGAQLTSEKGEAVQLRGVSTHGLAWYPQYVNQALFEELRQDWGANVVRLALYTAESGGYCTDGDRASLEQLVIDGVRAATEADLYVIVDWHILSDNNPLQHADEAQAFFEKMSKEFADYKNVIYEICNEPNGDTSWEQVRSYAERIIPVIRANVPDAVIVVGTPMWSQLVDEALAHPLDADNVMYALHFYAATHQQDLRDRMAQAVQGGLPVFVTEFGICDASGNGRIDYESADAWVALMDDLKVSYVCWNLSNKNEASALIDSACSKTSGFVDSDLSAEGLWLREILTGGIGSITSNPSGE